MARLERRLPANVAGDFFVDASCIDCGTCMWMAPKTFDEVGDQSRVHTQPTTAEETRLAELALIACPTASIGLERKDSARALAAAAAAFPRPIAHDAAGRPELFHCGFHDEQSFGAASWLIVRPQGNVLIDVPRWSEPLVQRIEALGKVALLFLTHRDDVADQAKFAARLGCRRVMHADDLGDATRDIEQGITGIEPVALAPDLLVLPTPGHTEGSACLLFTPPDRPDAATLFSGDHLAWSAERGHLYAFRGACWFDWNVQRASMERLTRYDFARVLPGHGAPIELAAAAMHVSLARCIEWMATA